MIGPAVQIRLNLKRSERAFHVRSLLGEELDLGNRGTIEERLFERPMLRANLEEALKLGGQELDLGFAKADKILRKLQLTCITMLLQILGDEQYKLAQLAELFQRAFRAVAASGGYPRVQIIAPREDFLANTFPFELLPLLGTTKLPEVHDTGSLGDAMGAFLGFSAIVERSAFGTSEDLELAPADSGGAARLPIKLFFHASLAGAVDEAAYLRRRADVLVEGPWPDRPVQDGAVFVASHIADPRTRLCGDARTPPDQVQHFSCHCDTLTGTTNHYFSLRPEGGQDDINIRLDELPALAYQARGGQAAGCDMPLVFFNNCGGAAVDPKQIGSFVEFFIVNNANRGFIGTQARIPDRLAEAYSKHFYSNFLRKKLPIGRAVTEARRAVALGHANPLSLLYVHYGPPELSVRSH